MLTIINAGILEAKEEMKKIDEYMSHTNGFYRNFFSKNKSMEEFQSVMCESVIDGTDVQAEMTKKSQDIIQKSLELFNIKLDLEMKIIYTDGSDNVGMPYTKGEAMVMPSNYHYPPSELSYFNPQLIVHELWHILSRKYPELRKAAYKSIGFKESTTSLFEKEKSKEAEELLNLYFVNPDAIFHDHYFENINHKGENFEAYPIFIWKGGIAPVIAYVENDIVVGVDRLSNNHDYVSKYSNVSYNTHPEEICAEHFRMMLMYDYNTLLSSMPNPKMMDSFKDTVVEFFN
jgi:hypothetical protein